MQRFEFWTSGPGGNLLAPGDELLVAHAGLELQQASRFFTGTSVRVDIGETPLLGEPDNYSIEEFDP